MGDGTPQKHTEGMYQPEIQNTIGCHRLDGLAVFCGVALRAEVASDFGGEQTGSVEGRIHLLDFKSARISDRYQWALAEYF